jgi:hypothetical protein
MKLAVNDAGTPGAEIVLGAAGRDVARVPDRRCGRVEETRKCDVSGRSEEVAAA